MGKQRTGILSVLNSKNKLRKRRGQPPLNPEIKVGIIARIKMYKRRRGSEWQLRRAKTVPRHQDEGRQVKAVAQEGHVARVDHEDGDDVADGAGERVLRGSIIQRSL